MPPALVEGLFLLPEPPSASSRRSPTKAAARPEEADGAEKAAAKAEDDRSEAGQGLLAARAALLELRGKLPTVLLARNPALPAS